MRLIDADALKEHIQEEFRHRAQNQAGVIQWLMEDIDARPTIRAIAAPEELESYEEAFWDMIERWWKEIMEVRDGRERSKVIPGTFHEGRADRCGPFEE